MTNKLDQFKAKFIKKDIPEIKIGDIVKIHLKLAEKTKAGGDKIQIFEGLVIAKKHGKGVEGTFTVRKITEGVGVEKIFPLHCPTISKIEVIKHSKVRRAKLYYMRGRVGKKARMSALKGTDLAEGGSAQKVTTEK
jgi:large subunit ribosomal protein L19